MSPAANFFPPAAAAHSLPPPSSFSLLPGTARPSTPPLLRHAPSRPSRTHLHTGLVFCVSCATLPRPVPEPLLLLPAGACCSHSSSSNMGERLGAKAALLSLLLRHKVSRRRLTGFLACTLAFQLAARCGCWRVLLPQHPVAPLIPGTAAFSSAFFLPPTSCAISLVST